MSNKKYKSYCHQDQIKRGLRLQYDELKLRQLDHLMKYPNTIIFNLEYIEQAVRKENLG